MEIYFSSGSDGWRWVEIHHGRCASDHLLGGGVSLLTKTLPCARRGRSAEQLICVVTMVARSWWYEGPGDGVSGEVGRGKRGFCTLKSDNDYDNKMNKQRRE
jgi:hypothetical protein